MGDDDDDADTDDVHNAEIDSRYLANVDLRTSPTAHACHVW